MVTQEMNYQRLKTRGKKCQHMDEHIQTLLDRSVPVLTGRWLMEVIPVRALTVGYRIVFRRGRPRKIVGIIGYVRQVQASVTITLKPASGISDM